MWCSCDSLQLHNLDQGELDAILHYGEVYR